MGKRCPALPPVCVGALSLQNTHDVPREVLINASLEQSSGLTSVACMSSIACSARVLHRAGLVVPIKIAHFSVLRLCVGCWSGWLACLGGFLLGVFDVLGVLG
jgi:hypothetical protein